MRKRQRRTLEERFWEKVDKDGPYVERLRSRCWVWTANRSRRPDGSRAYGMITIDKRPCYAHRVSYEMANGKIPEGRWILHHCDNPACVRPDHLYVGDPQDNATDRVVRGGQVRGERHAAAKLTEAQVMEIIARSKAGETYTELASEYGVTRAAIWQIATGRTWTHLQQEAA